MSLNKFTDNKIKTWLKIHASEIICAQGIKKSEQQTHSFEPPTTQDSNNDGHFLSYNHTTKQTEWKPVSGADSLTFISTWDADTNTPSLQNGVGQKNNYYVVQNSVNATSTTTTIDGISSFSNNDWIIFNGTVWNKIDNQNNVKSVNGKVGTVVLSHNDLTDKGTLTHDQIETKLTSIDAKDTQQDTKIATLESENTTQNNRLTTLESKDVTQDSRITTSEGKISALEISDFTNSTNISTLQTQVTNVETVNTNQSARISTNEGKIASIETLNTTQDTRLTAVETKNTSQDVFITNQSSNLDNLNAKTQNMPIEPLGSTTTRFNNNVVVNGYTQSQDFFATNLIQCNNISNTDLPAVQAINIAPTTADVKLTGSNYTGTSNAMIRLNTDGTIEKTPILIDGASNNNISGVNTLTSNSIASGNILNSSSILSPNITLGTFGGGTGSAGTLDLNSGNVTNTGNITAITDNTKDIGSTTIKYKDIHIGGDVFVAGDTFGLSSKIADGQTITSTLQTDLNVQKNRITTNENNITALQQFASPTEFVYNLSMGNLLSNAPVRDDSFSTLSEAKVFITKLSQQTLANIFLSYTRNTPNLTEVKLDTNTSGTTSTEKYVSFRDSGGLPNDYAPNESYNITFDAGVGNTWEMKTITCSFEHSGSGIMYDRLGLQSSADGVTYQNVSLSDFYQSSTTTPPWSTTRSSTTDGYIFPTDQTNIANVTYTINSRYIKFFFSSDGSSQRPGWDIVLQTSDAFNGSALIPGINTTANTKYPVDGAKFLENSGSDIKIDYEMTTAPYTKVDIAVSIPLVNFNVPTGWTEIAKDASQLSLTGDINGSSLSVSGDINLNGNIYQNGVLFTGGSGSVSGITSLDNGNGDIEISFSGTDYKQAGYLSIDANGRIQVTPSLIVTNAEYDSINTKWLNQKTDPNRVVQKIYLPNGVPLGGFDHTIHKAILVGIAPTFGTRFFQETAFVGYIENGTPRTSIGVIDIPGANVFNAYEIYTNTSQGHPNNVVPSDEKQHIINHFTSDYNHTYYPNYSVTGISAIGVQTVDVGSWDESKPFFVVYNSQTGSNFPYIFTLYGSQNGWTQVGPTSNPPAGYTLL